VSRISCTDCELGVFIALKTVLVDYLGPYYKSKLELKSNLSEIYQLIASLSVILYST